MKQRTIYIRTLVSVAALLWAGAAYAQIGPELIPPGLEPNHPIESYTKEGGKKLIEDWRHEASWELNASDVVFSAAKKRQLISEAPSTIHVITEREISAHGWRSLAEILRHVPGVQTMMSKSQFQSVMIRGLVGTEDNNSRILWLQNGVPMNDVRDSGIWLDETYPVEMIKRIEVVLGPGSALYGSGAFQGVVNIFTKDPADINKYGEYRLAIQNNMTFKASAIAGYTSESGNFGILGHVAGNTTQGPGLIGDYVYTNYAMLQASTNLQNSLSPDAFRAESLKPNSDKHWYNIDFKLNYKAFKWDFGFTDIYAGADGNEFVQNVDVNTIKEFPGDIKNSSELEILGDSVLGDGNSLNTDRYLYRFNRREFYNDFIFEDSFGDNVSFLALLSYRLNYYDNQHYRNFRDSKEIIEDYCANDQVCEISAYNRKVNFDTLQHKVYGLAQVQWRIYDANELIAGVVLEYQHIDSPDFMDGQGIVVVNNEKDKVENSVTNPLNATKLGQLTPSVFLQDEQRFWDDRIILTAGARFDAYRIYMSGDKEPDYAPSWRFAFLGKWTDWMTMRLSYGYSFKEPSLYQLYIDTFDVVGNPGLKPETLHNVELSFLFTPTYFMKIRLDGFATLMDNLIVMRYDPSKNITNLGESARYFPVQNEGEGARIFGFELSLDAAIGKYWNFYAHYNFLYSQRTYQTEDEDISSDKSFVPDDAMHRAKLGATFMNDYMSADMALFMVGGTPETQSNSGWETRKTYATPFYAILQPQVSVNVGANIGLMLQGSYAFSEGVFASPTYRYYYEKEGVPVSRYSVMFSLIYPFKK